MEDKDLIIEPLPHRRTKGMSVYRASPGVRITHVPTGIIVEHDQEKSQLWNKKIALAKLEKILKARLN